MEGMNRSVIPALVVVVAVAGTAAVAIAITDRPGAAPAPRKPIARVAGSYPLSTLTLRSVRRTGSKVVSVQLDASLGRGSDQTWMPPLRVDEGDNGLRLLDEVNGRSHAPLRDGEGECLCTGTPMWVQPGERIGISAKFPAPPAGVDEVSVHARGFPSFDRVPLAR